MNKVDSIVNELYIIYVNKKSMYLTHNEIGQIVTEVMISLEKMKDLSGSDKKDVVLKLIYKLFPDISLLLLNSILPSMIDNIVKLAKSGFKKSGCCF